MLQLQLEKITRDGQVRVEGANMMVHYVEDALRVWKNGMELQPTGERWTAHDSILIAGHAIGLPALIVAAHRDLQLPVLGLAQLRVGYVDGNEENLNPTNLVPLMYPNTVPFTKFVGEIRYKRVPHMPGYWMNWFGDLILDNIHSRIEWEVEDGIEYANVKVHGDMLRVRRKRLWALTWMEYPAQVDSLEVNDRLPFHDLIWNHSPDAFVEEAPSQCFALRDVFSDYVTFFPSLWDIRRELNWDFIPHNDLLVDKRGGTPVSPHHQIQLVDVDTPVEEIEWPETNLEDVPPQDMLWSIQNIKTGQVAYLSNVNEVACWLRIGPSGVVAGEQYHGTFVVEQVVLHRGMVYMRPHEVNLDPERVLHYGGEDPQFQVRHISDRIVRQDYCLQRIGLELGISHDELRGALHCPGSTTAGGYQVRFWNDRAWPEVRNPLDTLRGKPKHDVMYVAVRHRRVIATDSKVDRLATYTMGSYTSEELQRRLVHEDTYGELYFDTHIMTTRKPLQVGDVLTQ